MDALRAPIILAVTTAVFAATSAATTIMLLLYLFCVSLFRTQIRVSRFPHLSVSRSLCLSWRVSSWLSLVADVVAVPVPFGCLRRNFVPVSD
ncbi:hypothetical protein L1987_82329 [Smallanthus sonchifolius]|uniref:Uncharacterized protein n=1 Tax=Smallanthus sonchifolius TaxID=185202 RepID=A0ACB8YEI8_9ASTR|nr:hypothetical protein L1987_82329 [Smallanthus sonchifolius]